MPKSNSKGLMEWISPASTAASARLKTIDTEPTRRFRSLRDGDYDTRTRALRAELLPERTDLGIHAV